MKTTKDELRFRKTHFVRNSIAGSVIIAILLLFALISFAPDSTPYSPDNYGWNGTRTISSQYSITEVSSLSNVPVSSENVILVIAPSVPFLQSQANFLKVFVGSGGKLIVADSSRISNSLLQEMGLSIQISSGTLLDPLYNWKSQDFPIGFASSTSSLYKFMTNVSAVAFDSTSPLIITSTLAEPLVVSSSQSEEAFGTNSGLVPGPFPLIAIQSVGKGFALVIGDSSFFTNSVIANANNLALVGRLFSNENVYLDTSHWPVNTAASLKGYLDSIYGILLQAPYRYVFVLLIVGATLLLAPAFIAAASAKSRPAPELKRTLNKDILERVKEDRRRFGIEH